MALQPVLLTGYLVLYNLVEAIGWASGLAFIVLGLAQHQPTASIVDAALGPIGTCTGL